jgi:hypothetical protein
MTCSSTAAAAHVFPEEDVGEGALDLGDGLPDELLFGVAEQARGGGVDGEDEQAGRVDQQQDLLGGGQQGAL